jgi:protein ImuA
MFPTIPSIGTSLVATSPAAAPQPVLPVRLRALRERIARMEQAHDRPSAAPVLPFGHAAIDGALPGGGLVLGGLHEAVSAGPDTEHAAASTLFVAGILARLEGPVLWVLRQTDLFAPGLAGAGLHPDRILFAEAGNAVLPAMEEGLRHPGLSAVVAELTGRLSLVASRRLQLAAEQTGVLAVLIRRSRGFDDPVLKQPSAATTRWRIAALPSPPVLPHAPNTPGLGPARWRLDLTRSRGGEAASWIVEACDATGRLGLVSDAADRSDQAPERLSA